MLYLGTDEGIYRWFPGSPWPIFHSLQAKRIQQLVVGNEGVLVALEGTGRIWETTNNGQDWREVPRPDGAGRPARLTLAGSPSRLILATAGPLALFERQVGLRIESDAELPAPVALARKWAPSWLSGGGATATARRKRAARAEDRTQRGWRPLGVPEVDLVGSLSGFDVLDTSSAGEPWFAAAAGGLWRSEDQGRSWVRSPGPRGEIACLRRSGKTLVAGTNAGVLVSDDGGLNWVDRSSGLEPALRIRALAVKPGNPKLMLAGASAPESNDCVLSESKDGGASWKPVARGFPVRLDGNPIIDIVYDPSDPDCCVVAAESGAMWRTQTDGLWWEPLSRLTTPARALCAVG
jgi:photosystem II stability/assembly factor-like uncharacterized protein